MRDGYKILDADCHQMEPPTLWEDHIDPAFRDRARPESRAWRGRRALLVFRPGSHRSYNSGNFS